MFYPHWIRSRDDAANERATKKRKIEPAAAGTNGTVAAQPSFADVLERLQEDLLDGVPELDLHDLDAQREVGEAEAHHLGQRVVGHLVVAELGEEVEAEAEVGAAGSRKGLSSTAEAVDGLVGLFTPARLGPC